MENDKKFKRLIESLESEYFFYSHDLDGNYLYISPSVEKVLGYTVEEAFGGIVKHMTDSQLNKDTIATLKKSASGEKQNTFEFELYTKSRDIKVIEITESPLYNKDGVLVSIEGVAHDITDRKRTEEIIKQQNDELQKTLSYLKNTQSQLIHSEKMGALGNLIAGIAHEINTPIGAIQASVGNIGTSLDATISNLYDLFTTLSPEELSVFNQIISLMDDKAPSLTSKEKREIKKELKATFQSKGLENAYVISDLVLYLNLHDKTEQLLPYLDLPNLEYILKSVKDVYSIKKNSANIQLAVDKATKVVFALKKFTHKDQGGEKEKTNLLDNIETVLTLHYNQLKQGIEVIRDFDDIPLISCYPDELVQVWTNLISNSIQAMDNQGVLSISVKKNTSNVIVNIKDTGCGIPEEIKEKIFEPFFTTKKAGEGTGIGLDIVLRIIEKHGATLDLESEVNVGTNFKITLPIND